MLGFARPIRQRVLFVLHGSKNKTSLWKNYFQTNLRNITFRHIVGLVVMLFDRPFLSKVS